MLMSVPSDRHGSRSDHESGRRGPDLLDLERLKAIARRQWLIFVLCCGAGLALGAAKIATSVPRYTASVRILIDDRAVRAVEDVPTIMSLIDQDAAVNSQVEVVRSKQIAEAAAEQLGLLASLPNYPTEPSLSALLRSVLDLRSWFDRGAPPRVKDPDSEKRAALGLLAGGMNVRRVPQTYVLSIDFTSPDRGDAARMANGIADAYILAQLESKYDSARRANGWLRERISELAKQSREADLAVERFRSENNLLAAGGRLITEQQAAEINSQLIIARADTARAKAKLDRINTIVQAGDTGALVTDALEQPVFTDLRAKYLDRAKRLQDLIERFGPDHIQVATLRNEMRDYERLMFDELKRLAASYRSDYEVAKSREKTLEQGLSEALGVTAEANDALVALRQLERQSDTFRTLHRNFLARYEEAMQKQSFPITEARVITRASPPDAPSYPDKSYTLTISLMLGAAAGASLAYLRERSDRAFRTGTQVRDELGVEFLGMLTKIRMDAPGKSQGAPEAGGADTLHSPPVMRFALEKPLSGYTETLRAMKIAAEVSLQDEPVRVIGIISVLPGEGKSTTAKNFASLLAAQGNATLLIDGDLRNPGLTRTLCPERTVGIVDVLLSNVPLDGVVLREEDSNLSFLPTVVGTRITHTADLLASSAMKRLLAEAGKQFSYIIVDLPPVGPVVDVRASAELFSGFVFVIEWGKTQRNAVRGTLETETQLRERCLGAVLNKVESDRIGLYESYGSKEYYYPSYAKYYRN